VLLELLGTALLLSYMQQHTAHCNNGGQTGSHYEIPVARLSFGNSDDEHVYLFIYFIIEIVHEVH